MALLELRGQLSTLTQILEIRESTQNLELKHLRDLIHQNHQDHEARLRLLEQRPVISNMETRILGLEQRRYVEPRTVWVAVGALTAASAVLVSIIGTVINALN
jgi:hypothetical protein